MTPYQGRRRGYKDKWKRRQLRRAQQKRAERQRSRGYRRKTDAKGPLTEETIMWFGQHKGQPLSQLPYDYRQWLREQPWLDEHWKTYLAEHTRAKDADRVIAKILGEKDSK